MGDRERLEKLGLENLRVYLRSENIDEECDGEVRGVVDLMVKAEPWNVYSRYVAGVRLRRKRDGSSIVSDDYFVIVCRNMRSADSVGSAPWREVPLDDVADYRAF